MVVYKGIVIHREIKFRNSVPYAVLLTLKREDDTEVVVPISPRDTNRYINIDFGEYIEYTSL